MSAITLASAVFISYASICSKEAGLVFKSFINTFPKEIAPSFTKANWLTLLVKKLVPIVSCIESLNCPTVFNVFA